MEEGSARSESEEEEEDNHVFVGLETQIRANEHLAVQNKQKEILKSLPRLQRDGTFKSPAGDDLSIGEVRDYTKNIMPLQMRDGVFTIGEEAEARALKIKSTEAASKVWTPSEKILARSMFEAADMHVVPHLYELYHGGDLKEDQRNPTSITLPRQLKDGARVQVPLVVRVRVPPVIAIL